MDVVKLGTAIKTLIDRGYKLFIEKMPSGALLILARRNVEERHITYYPDGSYEETVYVVVEVPLTSAVEYVIRGFKPSDPNLISLINGGDEVIVMGRVFRVDPKSRSMPEAIAYLIDLIETYGGDPNKYVVRLYRTVE